MHTDDDKPDWEMVGLGQEDDSTSAERFAQSTQLALAIVGDDADHDDCVVPTARLIRVLGEDLPAAIEGLAVEEVGQADRRRALQIRAIAQFRRSALAVRDAFPYVSVPTLATVFRAVGFDDVYCIAHSIIALQRGDVRDEPIAPSVALIQALIAQVGMAWVDMTGDLSAESFAPDAAHCSPHDGLGAEYIFRVLNAAGFRCSRDEIRDNIGAAIELMVEKDMFEGPD